MASTLQELSRGNSVERVGGLVQLNRSFVQVNLRAGYVLAKKKLALVIALCITENLKLWALTF